MSHPKKKVKYVKQKKGSSSLGGAASADTTMEVDDSVLTPEVKDIDAHPLAVGHSLLITSRHDDRYVKILERKRVEDDSNLWQYYVHYYDFNRRLDEWIESSRILKFPSEANAFAADLHHGDVGHDHGTAEDADDMDLKRPRQERGAGYGPTTVAELEHDEHEGMDEAALREHEEVTKVKNIRNVLFGKHLIECWYFSPYPKEYYPDGPVDCLYICEFSFRFFRTKTELGRYLSKPNLQRHPPGNEIYRDEHVSMFEVDGAVEKYYCQNLSYFAKLFLDHKTLYFDVDPFLFYVLCSRDEQGFHPVGYYSKEKYSDLGYNLACILTFPSAQRKGYGRFLIAFSYELSKKEEKVGSPEKPLSDLGAISYKSYWSSTILSVLRSFPGDEISVMDLSILTSIVTDDVLATLQSLGLLRNVNGNHVIYAPPDYIDAMMKKYPINGLLVDPAKLHWVPLYVTDPRKDKWSVRGMRESFLAADDVV